MEEDIEILEEFIKDYEATTDPLEQSAYFEEVPAKTIRNIINKYKEQEEQIEEYKLNVKEAMNEAQENARLFRKEQAKKNEYKKMVELMSNSIHQLVTQNDIAKYFQKRYCKAFYSEDISKCKDLICEECVKNYFIKKAKGE